MLQAAGCMLHAASAASIAAANSIRPDNGMRFSIGYYNYESAFSLGGRHDDFTFTVTIDTASNVGAGIGFDL